MTAALLFVVASQFTPLSLWKSDIAAGNPAALTHLYLQSPPAQLYAGRDRVPSVSDEALYWTDLRKRGVEQVDPKVLEINEAPDQTRIVLRIAAKQGQQKLVASMQQIWIKQDGQWRMAASQRSDFYPDNGRALPEPAKPNAQLYGPPSDARREIADALKQAKAQHKRVIVVFGANWCYDCHVLDTTFRSPQFAPIVNANYIVVHVSIGDDGKDNNDLAAGYGVAIDKGVPSLAVLDATGKVIKAQQSGEFENTTKIGPKDVMAFLEQWKPR